MKSEEPENGANPLRDVSAGGPTCLFLDSVSVTSPPGRVVIRDITAPGGISDSAVEQLTDNVCVAGVTAGLGGHVHQNPSQGHWLVPPPRHLARTVQVSASIVSSAEEQARR